MNNKSYQLQEFKKFLLNRVNVSPDLSNYIETCLANEDEGAKHSFHKIMVHNWSNTQEDLFNIIFDYFSVTFIPVNYTHQGNLTTFYTSSLILISKIMKLDFMFPFERNMYNIDILFNDKSSLELFDTWITIDNIVGNVVSNRFNEKFELNLSNFCNDPEFEQKNICFYKLGLLAHFKILMLRMGRDTQLLNLSNNNLSQIPQEILNFFIKGNLVGINLSNNNLPSLAELHRHSSKIEKLWIEGNPLCDDIDPASYVKQITMKLPRVQEIDGVKINESGLAFPFFRNYLVTPDRRTKMVVEKFLSLYFSYFDMHPRKRLTDFYDTEAKFTIASHFPAEEEKTITGCASFTRNILDPVKRKFVLNNRRIYCKKDSASAVLNYLPKTFHDPTTFCVDVLLHDKNAMILVVDGVYKEESTNSQIPDRLFAFRRTFVFKICIRNMNSIYLIVNDMLNITLPTKEQIDHSFKKPLKNMNSLALIDPDAEESDAIIRAFCHFTQLKRDEAEARLKALSWDLRKALKNFMVDLKADKIGADKFVNDDDSTSDLSTLSEDDID